MTGPAVDRRSAAPGADLGDRAPGLALGAAAGPLGRPWPALGAVESGLARLGLGRPGRATRRGPVELMRRTRTAMRERSRSAIDSNKLKPTPVRSRLTGSRLEHAAAVSSSLTLGDIEDAAADRSRTAGAGRFASPCVPLFPDRESGRGGRIFDRRAGRPERSAGISIGTFSGERAGVREREGHRDRHAVVLVVRGNPLTVMVCPSPVRNRSASAPGRSAPPVISTDSAAERGDRR